MKQLLTFLLPILIISCANHTNATSDLMVGKMMNNTPTVTMNKKQLIKTYNRNINARITTLNLNFFDVQIVRDGKNYYLLFIGNDVRSFMELQTEVGPDGIITFIADGKTSFTSTDCVTDTSGCKREHANDLCLHCSHTKHKKKRIVSDYNMLR